MTRTTLLLLAILALAPASSLAAPPLQAKAGTWHLACDSDALTNRPACELAAPLSGGASASLGVTVEARGGTDLPAVFVAPAAVATAASLVGPEAGALVARRAEGGRLWLAAGDTQAGFLMLTKNGTVQVRVQGAAGTAGGTVSTDGFAELYLAAMGWLGVAP